MEGTGMVHRTASQNPNLGGINSTDEEERKEAGKKNRKSVLPFFASEKKR